MVLVSYSINLDGSTQSTALLCIKDNTHVIIHRILKAQISANVMAVKRQWVCIIKSSRESGAQASLGSHEHHFYSAESRVVNLSCQKGTVFFLSLSHFSFVLFF